VLPLQPSPSSLSRVQHQPRRLTPLSPRPVASGPAPPPFCPNEQATGYPGYRHAAGTFVTSHLAPYTRKTYAPRPLDARPPSWNEYLLCSSARATVTLPLRAHTRWPGPLRGKMWGGVGWGVGRANMHAEREGGAQSSPAYPRARRVSAAAAPQ